MGSQSLQTVAVPLERAIDYYFELALYLLVLTGFATLASTGGLDLPATVLTGVALAVRGYLLAKRRQVVISEGWTTPLTIAYFVFFAADYFVFSRNFLPATVHLALFGVVIRSYSLRKERDYITLAILSFLMVLASAVLTVDSTFLIAFSAFILMAVATFILMEMRNAGRAASVHARHSSDPQEHRRLAFSLVRFSPALLAMILVAATAIFFLIPRLSAGYFSGYTYGTDYSSGFSDHVRLGKIGEIQQSNAVVMHIQIDGDSIGRYDLHWRGVALSNFDGRTWSNSRDQFLLTRTPSGFAIPRSGEAFSGHNLTSPDLEVIHSYLSRLNREQIIHYHVLMEPIGTSVFFLAPWGRNVNGDYRMVGSDSNGAVYNFDTQHAISGYEADSDIATARPEELRSAGQEYPAQIANVYLRVPPLDPRIAELAARITASSNSNFDKADAIDNYLRTHFGYTLRLPQNEVQDPLANFLFVRKQGHCEYFASSMAVMLRTLGVPSRVVNGFRTDEFNDLTGNYVVRAKDAHSWVEAYFPGYGWQTFDPTPASNGGGSQGWGRIGLYADAVASFWRDWVVAYDSQHQYVLGQTAVNSTRNVWESVRSWASDRYQSMLRWARQKQDRIEHSPIRWAVVGGVVALVLVIVANVGRILRALHELWLRAHPEKSPEQAAAMWYHRMVRTLARRGVPKPPAQTPQEFVRKIKNERLREPVERFTSTYESARFGNSVKDVQRLPELYEEVELAAKHR